MLNVSICTIIFLWQNDLAKLIHLIIGHYTIIILYNPPVSVDLKDVRLPAVDMVTNWLLHHMHNLYTQIFQRCNSATDTRDSYCL